VDFIERCSRVHFHLHFSLLLLPHRSTLARDEPLAGAVCRCQKKIYAREFGAALLACLRRLASCSAAAGF
jgi:hypothetical protein